MKLHMPAALSKQIGPLPAGGWLVAIVGGVGVAVFIRRRANNAESYDAGLEAGEESVAGDATDGLDGRGFQNGESLTNQGSGNLYRNGGYAVPPTNNTPIRTNAEWKSRASTQLMLRGYVPWLVYAAIERWFAGKRLSGAQQNIINEAIGLVGPPPRPPKHKPPVSGGQHHNHHDGPPHHLVDDPVKGHTHKHSHGHHPPHTHHHTHPHHPNHPHRRDNGTNTNPER